MRRSGPRESAAAGQRLHPSIAARIVRRCALCAGVALVAAFSGCATMHPAAGSEHPDAAGDDAAIYDPLERFNRPVFEFNVALDRTVIKPVAQGYRDTVPKFLRDRLRNFSDNLSLPRVLIHNVLQLRFGAANKTLGRFLLNSIFGGAGLFDLATDHGLPRQSGDLGQTLYRWGVADGPYLVLPFFGPSNLRDTVGLSGDLYTDFQTDAARHLFAGRAGTQWNVGRAAASGIDLRSRNIESLDEIEASALDFYAQLRSVVRQRRRAELNESLGASAPPLPDLGDPGAPPN